MKVWFTDYQLFPKGMDLETKGSLLRSGALIRVEFEDGAVGYADVCPYTKFGDAPIEVQIRNLYMNQLTPLLKQSMVCARRDADARRRGETMYSDVTIKNHFLINDLLEFDLNRIRSLQGQGYSEFKIKMGIELLLETEMLRSLTEKLGNGVTLRLDFNTKLTERSFHAWLDDHLGWLRDHLDFIEDPYRYEPKAWEQTAENYKVKLAVDFGLESQNYALGGVRVVIVKPAVQSFETVLERLQGHDVNYVVTHYLDFPVGQMYALAEAQRFKPALGARLLTCGLQHQEYYEPFQFQNLIGANGAYVVPPAGTGLGFDEALEKQEWHALK